MSDHITCSDCKHMTPSAELTKRQGLGKRLRHQLAGQPDVFSIARMPSQLYGTCSHSAKPRAGVVHGDQWCQHAEAMSGEEMGSTVTIEETEEMGVMTPAEEKPQ